MRWPKRYPVMRSAAQAMYMRHEAWQAVLRNPYMSYSEMKKHHDFIADKNKFIEDRSLSHDDFVKLHNTYSTWYTDSESEPLVIAALSETFDLSERSIKYLLKQTL